MINSNNKATFSLNGETTTVTTSPGEWIYTGNTYSKFRQPIFKVINGYKRKLVSMCVKQVGYIITGTTVSDVKMTLDFEIEINDGSGDEASNQIVPLSSVGVGPIVFGDNITEPTIFQEVSDNKLGVVFSSGEELELLESSLGLAVKNFKLNRTERKISSQWSIWYPSTVKTTLNEDNKNCCLLSTERCKPILWLK